MYYIVAYYKDWDEQNVRRLLGPFTKHSINSDVFAMLETFAISWIVIKA